MRGSPTIYDNVKYERTDYAICYGRSGLRQGVRARGYNQIREFDDYDDRQKCISDGKNESKKGIKTKNVSTQPKIKKITIEGLL